MQVQQSDHLVIFGVMGDLARKMTWPSLYRLERRRLLSVPIVGSARRPITTADLLAHAHDCVEDVVQNHLLQVMSLTMMEPPTSDLKITRQDLFRAVPDADP